MTVELDEDYDASIRGVNVENDNQLETALETLRKEIESGK